MEEGNKANIFKGLKVPRCPIALAPVHISKSKIKKPYIFGEHDSSNIHKYKRSP